MNLQQLRYVRALAEAKSFVAAAELCRVTQPTLSNGIAQLERDLGGALFARTTRSVQMTAFGRDLLPSLLDVLSAQQALVARARQLVQPTRALIRIGLSPLIDPKIVEALSDAFRRNATMTEIVFREMNLTELARMLRDGQLDFVIGPADEAIPLPKGWRAAPLYSEPLCYLVKGPGFTTRAAVSLSDLSTETFVMVPDACGLAKATRAVFAKVGVELREYSGQAQSYRVLQDWAAIGIGSAILPLSKLRPGTGARLTGAAEQAGGITIDYHAIWREDLVVGPELARFAQFLQNTAPEFLAGMA